MKQGAGVHFTQQERKTIMFDIFNMLKKEEHKDAKQVTRETIIGDILDMDQTTAPYFISNMIVFLSCWVKSRHNLPFFYTIP